jgi:nickel/cobalt transporter (NicO) family protein
MDLSLIYFPSAVMLGALHALEPGHAKTLTAAYLIGTKGTKRDAALLGVSVAFTHSLVVIGLSVLAVFLGRETFTDEASFYLAVGSSLIVMALGSWLLVRRMRALGRAKVSLTHSPLLKPAASKQVFKSALSGKNIAEFSVRAHEPAHEHDHALLSDLEHAKAHAADLPAYVHRGERPTVLQIMAFGAAGGLVPCPAAVSVMLLSLSLSESGRGLIMVLGFSLGLAITLVGIGLLVVTGLTKIAGTGKFSKFSALAPSIAAGMVIVSGALGLVTALVHHT